MLWASLRCQSTRPPASVFFRNSVVSPRLFSQTAQPRNFFRISQILRQESAPGSIPSFRSKIGHAGHGEAFSEMVGKPGIRNQILFVAGGSFLAFMYAASQTNIETDYWTKKMTSTSSVWTFQSITSTDLKRAQNSELIRDLREWFAGLNLRLQEMPGLIRPWVGLAFVSVLQPYADASEGKRLCWKICLFNAAVWVAWKVRRWQGPMSIRFMHNPLSGLSFTLLTSMFRFSQKKYIPGSAAYFYLLREQGKAEPPILESTAAYHFLAFFISAGLFSGLVSHVVNAKFLYPRLVAQLATSSQAVQKADTWASAVAAASAAASTAAKKKVPEILPSLGASGAIYAAVTMTALAFPDSQIALFIPPSYPVNIQWGVGGLVALDMIGILRGWRYFDHWAHLGGAAFGVAYYAYGPTIWNHIRRTLEIQYPSDQKT
ncbi:hypothetical protein K443DRAFT_128905 [Laccaria amethystina LaAM-08-1]|uniref:Peptidase S54 rhomboid domain-containing protein n=1 Tax=Laccaria amethystina LaAM-08-1 TaxID=1095629 RepID=A0A0C9YI99_9AGAR|nr:hypothetical protein K443DRAFT_128905 [Laccaria amethystina LaAM-08-1]